MQTMIQSAVALASNKQQKQLGAAGDKGDRCDEQVPEPLGVRRP